MSTYPVLDNKPIDQWKVTELKEELKRRKLTTKGLKDDLIKRLDEAIQQEWESAKENVDNGIDCALQPVVQSEGATSVDALGERTGEIMEKDDKRIQELNSNTFQPNIDTGLESVGKEVVVVGDSMVGVDSTGLEPEEVFQATNEEISVQATTEETSAQAAKDETSVLATTEETRVQATTEETSVQLTAEVTGPVVSEIVVSDIAFSEKGLLNNKTQNKSEDSKIRLQEYSNPPHEEDKPNTSDLDNQVFEVRKVISDSISTDYVSNNEKIELKDNIINDAKLEFDVKPETEEPSFSNITLDDGKLQSMDVEEAREDKVTCEETCGNNAENLDSAKKNDSGDVGSSEKLNLDRSFGDDSMEEDGSGSKHMDLKPVSDEVGDKSEKTEVPGVKEEVSVDALIHDLNADKKVENKNDTAETSVKRKLHVQETVGKKETTKRQRRWNSDVSKGLEPQSVNISPSATPKDTFQSALKRNFSRSDSTADDETPKERIVPPSSKSPTNSLKIDRFLRPFTLKAVQELVGKTGTVTNFWMDHIKTHCYVSYSSVEEAAETRNAVYNLQWPPNGGRLLVAEFVEPQEVKMRVEAPQSPVTPASAVPVVPPAPVPVLPHPSPRLQVQREPLPLPPPPPLSPPQLSNPPQARERPLPHSANEQLLPPPPPLPQKVDPPIVTLDDLFRKTKATPRIYYLPLTDEQVAAKEKPQGKTIEQ